MPLIRDQYMGNPSKYLSPPVSPKQHFELSFRSRPMNQATASKDEHEDWISVESLPLSPTSSSSYSTQIFEHTVEQQQLVKTSFIVASSRRKQKKPNPSLPTSTAGAFQMPFVSHDAYPKDYRTSISFISPPESSCPNHTDVTRKKKRRHRNDCATISNTMCLASIKKEQKSSQSSRDCMSIHAILDQELVDTNPLATQPLNESLNEAVISADEDGAISKKAKTDAALIYDNLSADSDQATLFRNSEEWIPSLEVFNRKPTVRISWKGSPLKIKHMPYFEKLHPGEATIAGTLRLTPEQYLKCKWALVLAAKHAYETNSMFRKSEAQKVCCIDVNKTSVLWNTFGKLGWLGPKWPH